jgi:hypothetical protein
MALNPHGDELSKVKFSFCSHTEKQSDLAAGKHMAGR